MDRHTVYKGYFHVIVAYACIKTLCRAAGIVHPARREFRGQEISIYFVVGSYRCPISQNPSYRLGFVSRYNGKRNLVIY